MLKRLLILSVFLTASMPVKAVEYIAMDVPEAKPVGQGRMSWMLWDLYDATLYAPKGEFNVEQPFALNLKYLRKLNGKDIADRSAEEMRKIGMKDEVTLATWHNQMRQIFPDVIEGKTLTGVYNAQKESVFYGNGVEVGRITDPDFGKYFFNIWLSEETSAPDLRAQLLGVQ